MAERIVLHIGAPKSGSTFLQTLLWHNRDVLSATGVLLPGKDAFDGNRVAVAVRNGAPRDPRPGTPAAVWQSMQEQMQQWPGTAVISNEWLGMAARERVEQAVAGLGPDRVHVIFTARDFVRQVPAAWQEALKLGAASSLTDFLRSLDSERETERWTWSRLDPAIVLSRWDTLLPPERIHVVTVPARAPDPTLLWRRFAGVCGIDPDACDTELAVPNESLSAESARLLQHVGALFRDAVDADTSHWSEPYRWLRRYVAHDLLVAPGGSRIVLRPDEVAQVRARAARTVEQIRERGYDVTGDLCELSAEGVVPEGRHPDDVTAAELLDLLAPLAAQLLRRVRDETERADAAEKAAGPVLAAADTSPEKATTGPDREPAEPTARPGRGGWATVRRLAPRLLSHRLLGHTLLGAERPVVSISRVYVLMFSPDGHGGVARTVLNLANKLADNHQVELIALYRKWDEPTYPVDPRITVTYLHDVRGQGSAGQGRTFRPAPHEQRRPDVKAWLHSRPSRLVPAELEPDMSEWTDRLMRRKLASLAPGVLVCTRPSLQVAASRLAPAHVILVEQEHLNFQSRGGENLLTEAVREAYQRLDCLVVLTEADARDYRGWLGARRPHVTTIPNAVPWVGTNPSPLTAKVVIAGGRLVQQKGFDRLIEAFAPVADAYPDWQLHIYGSGRERRDLRRRINRLGIADRAILQGHSDEFRDRLHEAGVFAMTSRFEGFPMVLVEAMSQGLPLVSFDCPRGPAEIIDDGRNGRLVPDGDVEAFTRALLDVIGNEESRRRMGAEAAQDAAQYDLDHVAGRWEALLEELLERRLSGAPGS